MASDILTFLLDLLDKEGDFTHAILGQGKTNNLYLPMQ